MPHSEQMKFGAKLNHSRLLFFFALGFYLARSIESY